MLKLNYDFINQVKYIKHNHLIILLYLYSWIESKNSPVSKTFENDEKIYFWVSIDKIARDLLLTRTQVQNALYRLENKDKRIESTLQPFIYPKQDKKENKLYLAFNPVMADFLLSDEQSNSLFKTNLKKRLNGNTYRTKRFGSKSYNNTEAEKMLLNDSDMNVKKKYCYEAELIAKKIITKYGTIFNHRIPEQGKEPTKTFIQICHKIQDIYNGTFTNSRYYPLSDKFLNSKQFNLDGYRETLQSVKGDWNKVRKLLLNSVKNFQLMFDENRMPFNKKYLQTNLNLWLYDDYTVKGEPQSQFIQSLKEPSTTEKQLSENKADRIFDELPSGAKKGANNLYDLAPKGTPAGTFFENVQKIVEWGRNVAEVEMNSKYWYGQSSELPDLFANFCKENKINVNCSTVDIEKAVNCNGPWVWFVKQASQEHDLNIRLCDCVTAEDLYDCYNSKSISLSDDVIF